VSQRDIEAPNINISIEYHEAPADYFSDALEQPGINLGIEIFP
jgi:hypothetical protein